MQIRASSIYEVHYGGNFAFWTQYCARNKLATERAVQRSYLNGRLFSGVTYSMGPPLMTSMIFLHLLPPLLPSFRKMNVHLFAYLGYFCLLYPLSPHTVRTSYKEAPYVQCSERTGARSIARLTVEYAKCKRLLAFGFQAIDRGARAMPCQLHPSSDADDAAEDDLSAYFRTRESKPSSVSVDIVMSCKK